jgi:hypothetical protein
MFSSWVRLLGKFRGTPEKVRWIRHGVLVEGTRGRKTAARGVHSGKTITKAFRSARTQSYFRHCVTGGRHHDIGEQHLERLLAQPLVNSLQSVPNIQSPGTEFLDAETGGQESTGWSVAVRNSVAGNGILDAETGGQESTREISILFLKTHS